MLSKILKFIILTAFFFSEWVETGERKAALRTDSTGTGKAKCLTLLGSSCLMVGEGRTKCAVQPNSARTLKWPSIIFF